MRPAWTVLTLYRRDQYYRQTGWAREEREERDGWEWREYKIDLPACECGECKGFGGC